jgi:hypothetical protein
MSLDVSLLWVTARMTPSIAAEKLPTPKSRIAIQQRGEIQYWLCDTTLAPGMVASDR